MNIKQNIFCMGCIILSSTFSGAMDPIKAKTGNRVPVTILKDFPDDDTVRSECGFSKNHVVKQSIVGHIVEAAEWETTEILERRLFHSGCSLFTLKKDLKTHGRVCVGIDPLLHLLAITIPTRNQVISTAAEEDFLPKLDVLLRYGFHIPHYNEQLKEYVDVMTRLSEMITSDPRIFGVFYHACERYKRNIGAPLALYKRKIPLMNMLGRDMYHLLDKELTDPLLLLHDHSERLKTFHISSSVSTAFFARESGSVGKWPADITLDQIKEKIGPAVLKNYDRLFKEWKDIHAQLGKKRSEL